MMMMMMMMSVLRRVETNIQCVYYGYIQLEIRYLVNEFRIRITSTYSSYYYLVSFILNNITLILLI